MVKNVKQFLSLILVSAMVLTGDVQTVVAAKTVDDSVILSEEISIDDEMANTKEVEDVISLDDDNTELYIDIPDNICGYGVYWAFNEATGVLTISGEGDMWRLEDVGPWAISKMEKEAMDVYYRYLKEYYAENEIDQEVPSSWSDTKKIDYLEDVTEVVVEEGVTGIGDFANMPNLKKVTISKSVEEIYSNAFMECTSLENVKFDEREGATLNIGENAFTKCAFSEFAYPDGVMMLFGYEVMECPNLTTITIPSSVYYIGCMDKSNPNLKSIRVDKGSYAEDYFKYDGYYDLEIAEESDIYEYDDTSATLTIKYNGNKVMPGYRAVFQDYGSEHGYDEYRDAMAMLIPWAQYYDSAKKIVIEDGYVNIGACAFRDFGQVTSITLPSSVVRIDNYAFSDCYSLETVKVNGKLETIGTNAFELCSSLKDISFIEGVGQIPYGCFSNSGVENVVIPNGVYRIGENAFSYCDELKSVCIGSTEATETSYISIGAQAFSNCVNLESFTVNDSYNTVSVTSTATEKNGMWVETVGLFEDSPKLKTVGPIGSDCDIEMGQTTGLISFISASGLAGSNYIEEILLPAECSGYYGSSNTNISWFYGCDSLKKITAPESLYYMNEEFLSLPKDSQVTIRSYEDTYMAEFCKNNSKVKFENLLDTMEPVSIKYAPVNTSMDLWNRDDYSNITWKIKGIRYCDSNGYTMPTSIYKVENSNPDAVEYIYNADEDSYMIGYNSAGESVISVYPKIGDKTYSDLKVEYTVTAHQLAESIELTTTNTKKEVKAGDKIALTAKVTPADISDVTVDYRVYSKDSNGSLKLLTTSSGIYIDEKNVNEETGENTAVLVANKVVPSIVVRAYSTANYADGHTYKLDLYKTVDGKRVRKTDEEISIESEAMLNKHELVYTDIEFTENLPKYNIVFAAGDNGAGEMEPIENCLVASSIKLPANTFTRKGYTFAGWKDEETGKTYTDGASVKGIGASGTTVTLTATWKANNYTIKFHSNVDKDTVKTQTLEYNDNEEVGGTKLKANSFISAGRVFVKWTTKADGSGETYTNEQEVKNLTAENNGVIELYAQWKTVDYVIFFDAGQVANADVEDGSLVKGGEQLLGMTSDELALSGIDIPADTSNGYLQVMTYGENINLSGKEYAVRGYTLSGWHNSKTNKVVKNESIVNLTTSPELITLTAQWTRDTYKINYNMNGSAYVKEAVKGVASYTVDDGEIILPTADDLVKTGYIFGGWYDNSEYEGEAITKVGGEGELKNYNLYAKWTPVEYTVIVYGTGGKIGEDAIKSYNLKYDEDVRLDTVPVRGGYKFDSWNTKEDGTGKKYPAKITKNLTVNGDSISLYAQWKANSYKITYNLNGGKQSKAPSSYVTGNQVDLVIPERTGYEFTGWSLAMKSPTEGKTADLGADNSIKAGSYGDIVLTANWKDCLYELNLYLNNIGNIEDDDIKDESDIRIKIEEEYGFKLNKDENGYYITVSEMKYSDEFKFSETAQLLEEAMITDAAKDKYSISTFTTEANGKGSKYFLDKIYSKLSTGEPVKLYVQWDAKTYFINYNTKDENSEDDNSVTLNKPLVKYSYNATKEIKLPVPVKTGYIFTGWEIRNKDKELVTATPVTAIPAGTKEDINVTPTWKPVEYTVILNAGAKDAVVNNDKAGAISFVPEKENSNTLKRENVKYDIASAKDLANDIYVRSGYKFEGFFTKANGKGDKVTSIDKLATKNNAKVTLYAFWSPNTHIIAYEYKNGDEILSSADVSNANPTVHESGKQVALKSITKPGYTFTGWSLKTEGAKVATDKKGYVTKIEKDNTENVILVGNFTENSYKVKINSNSGVNGENKKENKIIGTVKYTEEFNIDEYELAYTRMGFVFGGFALDAKGKNPIAATDISKLSEKNNATVTIYVVWDKVAVNKPTFKVSSTDEGDIEVTIDDAKDGHGYSYAIEVSESYNFRIKETTWCGDSAKIDVEPGKTYFVRVKEAQMDSCMKFYESAWSGVKSVTTVID